MSLRHIRHYAVVKSRCCLAFPRSNQEPHTCRGQAGSAPQTPCATARACAAGHHYRRAIMRELRDAFEKVWHDLVRHGYITHDEQMMQAAWWQFVSDMQRNLYPAKATQ